MYSYAANQPHTARPLPTDHLNELRLWFLRNDSCQSATDYILETIFSNELFLNTEEPDVLLNAVQQSGTNVQGKSSSRQRSTIKGFQNYIPYLYQSLKKLKKFISNVYRWKLLYGFCPYIFTITPDGQLDLEVMESSIDQTHIGHGDAFNTMYSFYILPPNYREGIFVNDIVFQFYDAQTKNFVRSHSNHATTKWRRENSNHISTGRFLYLYIWNKLVPELWEPKPKTVLASLFYRIQQMNDLEKMGIQVFARQSKTTGFVEALPLMPPDHNQVIAAQMSDINMSIQQLQRKENYENDEEAQLKVRYYESMRRSVPSSASTVTHFDPTKSGKIQKVEVNETDFYRMEYIPTGFKLSDVKTPPDVRELLDSTHRRQDYLDQEIERTILGINIAVVDQTSVKSVISHQNYHFEMRKFEMIIRRQISDVEDFLNFIHETFSGILMKSGYTTGEEYLQDIDLPLEELQKNESQRDENVKKKSSSSKKLDQEKQGRQKTSKQQPSSSYNGRQLDDLQERIKVIQENFEEMLHSKFKYIVQISSISEPKEIASLVKEGVLSKDEGKEMLF